MAFCLPPEFADKFLGSLQKGEIVPENLAKMSSEERRAFFAEKVGEENAADVNALFESKLLLKDQNRGFAAWASKVSGLSPQVRKDMLARIESLDKVLTADEEAKFLEDLASQKLGSRVSYKEAQKVVQMTKDVRASKEAIPTTAKDGGPEEMEYGLKLVQLQKTIALLKGESKLSVEDVAGIPKSLLSSGDISNFLRQGLPVLLTRPFSWLKAFYHVWGDVAKELIRTKSSIDPMDLIKARIYSMKEARDGSFDRIGIDIGLAHEEAIPSSIPGRIPAIGRLFNASETAFQGAALRMRADIARTYLKQAKALGVDVFNDTGARNIGQVINSMTGRGQLNSVTPSGAKLLNLTFFSPRFLKGNWNTLTAHSFGVGLQGKSAASRFARRRAAGNMLKIIGTTAAFLTAYEMLKPGSVEFDPRSSKSGKVRLDKVWLDVTGGKAAILTLASRLVPTKHGNTGGMFGGGWGFWYKSGISGEWTDLSAGKYGQIDGTDIFENFFEGKTGPVASLVRDLWAGKNFQGNKVTPTNAAFGAFVPLPIQSEQQRKDTVDLLSPEGVAATIFEALGASASTYAPKK